MTDMKKSDAQFPLVSICIISYNSAKTIIETIDSVAAQIYKNIEIIVSDDCSTDNTVELCLEWKRENLGVSMQIVTTDKNTGVSGNLNRGFRAARGEWIKLMAADDLLFDYSIQRYLDYAINNNKEVMVARLHFFGDNQENIRAKKPYYDNYFNKYSILPPKERYKLILTDCVLPMPGFFISARLLEKIGYINDRYQFAEEWPTYLTLFEHGYDIPYVDQELVKYRCEGNSLGSNEDNKVNIRVFRDAVKSFCEFRRPLMLKNGLWLQAWDTTITYYVLANTYYAGKNNLIWRMVYKTIQIVNPLKYVYLYRKIFCK